MLGAPAAFEDSVEHVVFKPHPECRLSAIAQAAAICTRRPKNLSTQCTEVIRIPEPKEAHYIPLHVRLCDVSSPKSVASLECNRIDSKFVVYVYIGVAPMFSTKLLSASHWRSDSRSIFSTASLHPLLQMTSRVPLTRTL